MTTAETYDADLAAALALAERFNDPEQCDGNGRCWINDALNNSWAEGLNVAQWVACAVVDIQAGFRRSAA